MKTSPDGAFRKTYNRIEKDKRAVDDIITRNAPPPLDKDYSIVESILERRRPTKCLSRSESVNMREDRDFSMMGIDTYDSGYVHQLEPICPVEVRDVGWIGALQARYPKSSLKLTDKYPSVSDDELADRYWRGDLTAKPSVEHATNVARVVSVEDEMSPVHPSKWEEALKYVAANDTKDS